MKYYCFVAGVLVCTGIISGLIVKEAIDNYAIFTREDKKLLKRIRNSLNILRRSHNHVLEVLDYHGIVTFTGDIENPKSAV